MQPSNSRPLIIFDFDGTICDSVPMIVDILNSLHSKYQFKEIDPATFARLRTQSVPSIIRALEIRPWLVPKLARETRAQLGQSLNELRCHLGMKELLARLKNEGFRLAIISSNTRKNVSAFLRIHQIDIFEKVFISNHLDGKSVQIRKLLASMKLKPGNAVYICDELRDLEAARQCGILSIAVSWGANTIETLKKAKPSLLAHSSEELHQAIHELHLLVGKTGAKRDLHAHVRRRDWMICLRLLTRCSKTYSIGTLAAPVSLRKTITLAYLLMRAADFVEDHRGLEVSEKLRTLDALWESIETRGDLPAKLLLQLEEGRALKNILRW